MHDYRTHLEWGRFHSQGARIHWVHSLPFSNSHHLFEFTPTFSSSHPSFWVSTHLFKFAPSFRVPTHLFEFTSSFSIVLPSSHPNLKGLSSIIWSKGICWLVVILKFLRSEQTGSKLGRVGIKLSLVECRVGAKSVGVNLAGSKSSCYQLNDWCLIGSVAECSIRYRGNVVILFPLSVFT